MTNDFQFQPKKRLFEKFDLFQKKKKKGNLCQKFSNFPAQNASNHREREGGEGKRELFQQTSTSNKIRFDPLLTDDPCLLLPVTSSAINRSIQFLEERRN